MKTETQVLIIVLAVSALILFLSEYSRCNCDTAQKIEGFEGSGLSKEAMQDIAAVYNKKELIVDNLNATASMKTNTLDANKVASKEIEVGKLNILPRGVIVAWNGTTAPYGWLLCDGQNGTPDLRGRFIYGLGARQGSQLGRTGGAETVTLSVAQMPAHAHRISIETSGGWKGTRPQGSDRAPGGTWNTESTGGSQPHENMPPYYVLAYIMKA